MRRASDGREDVVPALVGGLGGDAPAAEQREALDAQRGRIDRALALRAPVADPADAGDFFYIPANTVHAIGGGCSIIEIQQNSDITYRLYDYGRPRELHLDQGIAVANGAPHDPANRRHVPDEDLSLVDGPYFRLDQIEGWPNGEQAARFDGAFLVIPRVGEMRVEDEPVLPGQCALARSFSDVVFDPNGLCLIAQPCERASDPSSGVAAFR